MEDEILDNVVRIQQGLLAVQQTLLTEHRKTIEGLHQARAEIMTLQVVCGMLLAEVAGLHDDPPERLGEMVAELQGKVAPNVQAKPGNNPLRLTVTRALDDIVTAAENSLAILRARRMFEQGPG